MIASCKGQANYITYTWKKCGWWSHEVAGRLPNGANLQAE